MWHGRDQVRISEDTGDPVLCGFHGIKTGLMSQPAMRAQGGNPQVSSTPHTPGLAESSQLVESIDLEQACRTPAMDLCCNCAWEFVHRHGGVQCWSEKERCVPGWVRTPLGLLLTPVP